MKLNHYLTFVTCQSRHRIHSQPGGRDPHAARVEALHDVLPDSCRWPTKHNTTKCAQCFPLALSLCKLAASPPNWEPVPPLARTSTSLSPARRNHLMTVLNAPNMLQTPPGSPARQFGRNEGCCVATTPGGMSIPGPPSTAYAPARRTGRRAGPRSRAPRRSVHRA